MINFYRKCLPRAAATQRPLASLLGSARKNDKRPVPWTKEAEDAFERCKKDVANATFMAYPNDEAEIRLVTDASDFAMGATLEQYSRKAWRPLAFFSKKFTPAQKKYSTFDRELTAVFYAIKHFQYYLESRKFKILTDHKPLVNALTQDPEKILPRRFRQLAYITQFDCEITYLLGKDNLVADFLSRIDAFRSLTIFNLEQLSAEQSKDEQLLRVLNTPNHPLKLRKLTWGSQHTPIYCDYHDQAIRPYLPTSLRKEVFDLLHAPAHPGARPMVKLITQKYVWPDMRRDIAAWCKNCLECQASKVTRYNKVFPGNFVAPDNRFEHVHIDIVGPLPNSEGYKYILTMIDRFTRWPEAIPLAETSAATVARAFYDGWISRYGAPTKITDQGAQFESHLFQSLLQLIGCDRIRTAAYHPEANGMVERWHRDLKAAIKCHSEYLNWAKILPTVLLGLRIRVRADAGVSAAEMVFGTHLRIPAEFVATDEEDIPPREFITEFQEYISQVKPIPVQHNNLVKPFRFRDLETCTHVFVRDKAVKPSLSRPYIGPFKVIDRSGDGKDFVLDINGSHKTVPIDLVKPAYFIRNEAQTAVNDMPLPPTAQDNPNVNMQRKANTKNNVNTKDNVASENNVAYVR